MQHRMRFECCYGERMTETSLDTRIRLAFDKFDSAPTSPLLDVLRRRLVAELIGDGDAVADTLAPGFALTIHGSPDPVTLTRDDLVATVSRQTKTSTIVWMEFDSLLTTDSSMAANGTLCTLRGSESILTTMPVGVFLEYLEGLFISEVAFMAGVPAIEKVDPTALPSLESLQAVIATK
jgi:hypothetical protein